MNEKQIELISAEVHKSFLNTDWQNQERLTDLHNPKFYKWCDKCHSDLYPYNELPENIKEYDRVTVKAVLSAAKHVVPDFSRLSDASLIREIWNDKNKKLMNKDWLSLNKEQEEIVKKIAAQYPYDIETVAQLYVSNGYSEETTIEILMNYFMSGR